MFMHNKRLMYTVRVSEPNPMLASLMLEQFGGPQGELAAALRYFTQAIAEDKPKHKNKQNNNTTKKQTQHKKNNTQQNNNNNKKKKETG